MESFVNNSSLISGELLEAASKALQREEKLRSSTLRSSVTSTDLENFFKTAPKFSEVEEEAFEEFWEHETTIQITKLQTVLIGQNVSSSNCTVAFDEDENKTVILEETLSYDTTVEWTKELLKESGLEEEEETKEWEDEVGDDKRSNSINDYEDTIMYISERKRKASHDVCLVQHKKAVYESGKYSCGQCDNDTTSKGNLAQHKRAVHEKVSYPCGQCDYKATTESSLI